MGLRVSQAETRAEPPVQVEWGLGSFWVCESRQGDPDNGWSTQKQYPRKAQTFGDSESLTPSLSRRMIAAVGFAVARGFLAKFQT